MMDRLQPVIAAVRPAWSWWIAELAAMMPPQWRVRSGRRGADIVLHADRVEIIRSDAGAQSVYVDRRPVEALDADAWGELGDIVEGVRARLILTPPDVYATTVTLPAQARNCLRSAIALQLDRIAPLRPQYLVWAYRALPGDRAACRATVAMARSARIAQLGTLFANYDIPMPAIAARVDDTILTLALGHDGSRTRDWRRNRNALIFAAGLLVSIAPVTTICALIATSTANGRAHFLRVEAAQKVAADRRARESEAIRAAIRPLIQTPLATALLDSVSRAMPETAFLRSASRTPSGGLRLEIDTSDAGFLEAALANVPELKAGRVIDQLPGTGDRTIVTFEVAS